MTAKSMPTRADHSERVIVDGRNFKVEFDADGNVLRIKERKRKEHPMAGVYDVSYYVPSSHKAPPGSRPARIIAAAREKMRQADIAHNATP